MDFLRSTKLRYSDHRAIFVCVREYEKNYKL